MQWLMRIRWMRLVFDTGRGYQQDNCPQMAAAVAYFTLLSVFPLLLLLASQIPNLLAIFSVHYDLSMFLLQIVRLNVSPRVAEWLSQSLLELEQGKGTAGVVGILTLVWTGSEVFGQLDQSFNRIWRVYDDAGRRTGAGIVLMELLRGRLLAFLLMLLVGIIILTTSVFTAGLLVLRGLFPVLPGSDILWTLLDWMVAPALSIVGLGLLYRFLPNTRVLWRDVWLGAVAAGLLNEAAKGLVTRFIARGVGGVYQSVAGPMALMVWVFFTCQIVFLGCELTRHYALVYGSRSTPAGVAQAAKVEAQLQERAVVRRQLQANRRPRLGARRQETEQRRQETERKRSGAGRDRPAKLSTDYTDYPDS